MAGRRNHMFRVTSLPEDVPGASPAALVRDDMGRYVLVLSAGLLAPDVIDFLDRLLNVGLSPLIAAGDLVGLG